MVALPLILLLAAEPRVLDEKELVDRSGEDHVRLSLPTQADVDAWHGPGFRLQLGYGYGFQHGSGPSVSFDSHSITLRPSVRLDDRWSLGVGLQYGTGPIGARWSVTVEPTFRLWRQLALSVGLGYGGLVIQNPNSGDVLTGDALVSRELADDEVLGACTGSALSAVGRLEYLFVAGPLFASGPFVQGNAQWTHCHEVQADVDNETGKSLVLSQWWRHVGLTLGWWLAWR
jgi:hypothetical protein